MNKEAVLNLARTLEDAWLGTSGGWSLIEPIVVGIAADPLSEDGDEEAYDAFPIIMENKHGEIILAAECKTSLEQYRRDCNFAATAHGRMPDVLIALAKLAMSIGEEP